MTNLSSIDYSSILSASSIDGISVNNTQKINLENIDLSLIKYLNQEFVDLGFNSIYALTIGNNYSVLFENSIELIKKYRRQLSTIERIQDQCYKLDKENEFLLKRHQALKDSNEISNRDLANMEEKLRQIQIKSNSYNKNIKDLGEENRKLQNTMEQRDKQFKHDRKKLEKEIEKLKERVQTLTTGKTKELPHIDLTETLYKSSSGPRATWNSDSASKKQLDLLSELIKDYDRKMKEVIVENNDLKIFLENIYSSLKKLPGCSQSDTTINDESNDENNNESFNKLVQLPFDNVYSKLNKMFQNKIKKIEESLVHEDVNRNSSNTTNNVKNCSISSISTIENDDDDDDEDDNESNNQNLHESLNTTFTIEPKLNEQNRLNHPVPKYFKNDSDKNTSRTGISALSVSSSSISSSTSSSTVSSECNSSILQDEKSKLAKEKKLFYEQKVKLEEDAQLFRKLSSELIKQKKDFQEEQEKFYQSRLFSSFSDSNTSKSQSKNK